MEGYEAGMRRILIAAVLLLAASCGPGGETITGADEGTTVELAPGERVTLELDSNSSTGYAWNLGVELDKNVVRLVSSDYEQVDDTTGGGGVERWVFEAVRPGDQTIGLAYYFQDEPERTAEEFTFHIVVREDA